FYVRTGAARPPDLEDVRDLADVVAARHQDRRAFPELVMLDDLLLRDVDLQRSPGLVRVLLEEDVPPVMEIHLRLAPADRRLVLDAAQLPLRISLVDRDEGHPAARVDEHSVMGLRRRARKDVHEADRA